MKTIQLLSQIVSIDIDKLSQGLCELHNEDEDKKAVLAFGMLDFKLCEMFDKMLETSIKKQFSSVVNMVYVDEINQFIKDCQNEVGKGVYKYAKMIA